MRQSQALVTAVRNPRLIPVVRQEKGDAPVQPEVIANLWTFNGAFMSGQLIYQVGIRLYVATGSDDEKTAMLRTLAAWDYHLAHVFPPSCGTTVLTGIPGVGSMEVKGVMPANAPGMELMDRFQDAFEAIKKSLPEHPSAGGIRRAPGPYESPERAHAG